MKHKLESRLLGELLYYYNIIIIPQICRSHHPYGRKRRRTKELLKVKEESEKVVLKLNIQKTKIMASGPITSWQNYGEIVTDFMFLGSKITADSD